MDAPIARRHALSVAVAAAFVATRLWLLFAYSPQYSDMDVYQYYATLETIAVRAHQSLWQTTAASYDRAAAAAVEHGRPVPLAEMRVVEYPPLGIAPIVVAARIVPATSAGWRERFARVFRVELFVVDLLAFCLVAALAQRRRALRLALYVASGLALCDFVYDRLDLVLGALVLGALALLVGRRHVAWAWLVLAVAAAYKLVPLALVPLFAVGALPPGALAPGRGLSRAGLVRAAAWCAGGVALAAMALALPSLIWGRATLAFLGYHAERGLQIESPLASLLLVLARTTGMPYAVQRHFGASELVAPATGELASASTLLVALATIVSALWLVRALAADPPPSDGDGRLAQRRPQLFFEAAVLTLLASMSVAKVLSPQYLLWLVPLVPLVRDVRIGVAFVAVAALTTLICPHLYQSEILRLVSGTNPPAGHGPTALGIALLCLRNGALAGLALWVARSMTQQQEQR